MQAHFDNNSTAAYFSDKFNLRGPFIIGGAVIALVGYIVLITGTRPGVAYVGTIIAAAGVFSTAAVNLAWAGSAAGGEVRKGASSVSLLCSGFKGNARCDFCYGYWFWKPRRVRSSFRFPDQH